MSFRTRRRWKSRKKQYFYHFLSIFHQIQGKNTLDTRVKWIVNLLMMRFICIRIIPIKLVVNDIFIGMKWFWPLQYDISFTDVCCMKIARLWGNTYNITKLHHLIQFSNSQHINILHTNRRENQIDLYYFQCFVVIRVYSDALNCNCACDNT